MNKSLLEALEEFKASLDNTSVSPHEHKIPLLIKLQYIIDGVRNDQFTY